MQAERERPEELGQELRGAPEGQGQPGEAAAADDEPDSEAEPEDRVPGSRLRKNSFIAQKEAILREKQENLEDARRKLQQGKVGEVQDMSVTVAAQIRVNEKNMNCSKIQIQKVEANIKLIHDDLKVRL